MATISELVVKITGDTASLTAALGRADKSASNTSRMMGNVLKVGALAGAAGIAGAAYALKGFVGDAMEAQKIQTQTNAVLESTKGISGMTAKSVSDLANSLSKVIPIDDELIQQTENMLLTFTSVGKDIFPQATEAALNMATALGGDPVDAALKLGKALNDPVAGVTALRKVGVMLTDQQRDQIKAMVEAGDVAGAQAVILKELETEFGNSGRAAGTTAAGQFAIFNTQVGNIKESIGAALIPVLTKLAGWMINEGIPAVQEFSTWLGPKLRAAGDLIQKKWQELQPEFEKFTVYLKTDVLPTIQAIVAWWEENWPKIAPIVKAAFAEVVAVVQTYLNIVKDELNILMAILRGDWGAAWEGIKQLVEDIFVGIKNIIVAHLTVIFEIAKYTLTALGNVFGDAWDGIKNTVGDAIDWIVEKLGDLRDAVDKALGPLDEIVGKAGGVLKKGFGLIPGGASGGVFGGLTLVGERGPELVNLPRGSRVYSNTESRQMVSQSNSRSQNFYGPVTVQVPSNASSLAEELDRMLR